MTFPVANPTLDNLKLGFIDVVIRMKYERWETVEILQNAYCNFMAAINKSNLGLYCSM